MGNLLRLFVSFPEEPELASQETPSRPSTGGSASGGTNGGSEGGGGGMGERGERVLTTSGGISRRESSGRIHKSEGKPTRVRTVLTEKQLHTLRWVDFIFIIIIIFNFYCDLPRII